jgi:hypothetical protein
MSDAPTGGLRPVWHWYAIAAGLLLIMLVLDVAGVLDVLGPQLQR